MALTAAGFTTSLVFLYIGLNTGNPFLLIGSLMLFGLSMGSIDYADYRRSERVSNDLNHTGAYRVGYEEDRA